MSSSVSFVTFFAGARHPWNCLRGEVVGGQCGYLEERCRGSWLRRCFSETNLFLKWMLFLTKVWRLWRESTHEEITTIDGAHSDDRSRPYRRLGTLSGIFKSLVVGSSPPNDERNERHVMLNMRDTDDICIYALMYMYEWMYDMHGCMICIV